MHRAFLYDGKTSGRQQATVKFSIPGYLVIEELSRVSRYALDTITVAPQLASQPAIVDLPDGARLEIADADAFYAAYEEHARQRQWVHKLESRWTYVALAAVLTLAFALAFYRWGIPAATNLVVDRLPVSVDQAIGSEGMKLLDKELFAPTELSAEKQAELQLAFDDVVQAVGDSGSYQLRLRRGEAVGANAFALPDGNIIVTDELVNLADHIDEVAAVMAHEVGHVRSRHSLRTLIQNSVVAGLVIAVTGDASSAGNLVAGLPALLAYAGYSREFEFEADEVAKEYLDLRGIPRQRFADLMRRMDELSPDLPNAVGLLRTHPATEDRLADFETDTQ